MPNVGFSSMQANFWKSLYLKYSKKITKIIIISSKSIVLVYVGEVSIAVTWEGERSCHRRKRPNGFWIFYLIRWEERGERWEVGSQRWTVNTGNTLNIMCAACSSSAASMEILTGLGCWGPFGPTKELLINFNFKIN